MTLSHSSHQISNQARGPAERFVFATDIQIYISHVNQGGHLDNAQLLTLVSEARVRFFQVAGLHRR